LPHAKALSNELVDAIREYPQGENKARGIFLKSVFALPFALASLPLERIPGVSDKTLLLVKNAKI